MIRRWPGAAFGGIRRGRARVRRACGIIGIGLGWLLGVLAAKVIPHFPPPAVPWWAIVGATGFSALVGMLFGILPARRAANLAPIEALRHE